MEKNSSKTCYLHIGLEKTGTTTIQSFLFENYDLLKRDGILVPICWQNRFCHNTLAILSYDEDKKDNFIINIANQNKSIRAFRNEALSELERELSTHSGDKVVFSSELIQSRLTSIKEIGNLKRLLSDMGFDRFKVIVYLREQSKLVCSLFYEAIKWDEIAIKDISSFLEIQSCSKERFVKKTKEDFQHICNHKQTLQWYSEVFGGENLIVKIFERDQWYQGSLVEDFMRSVGIESRHEYLIPEDQNKSINAVGLMILDEFNQHFPVYVNGLTKWRDWGFLQKVQKSFSLDKKGVDRLQIPFEILEYFRDINFEGNCWVREKFFPYQKSLFKEIEKVDITPPPFLFLYRIA